MYAQAENDDFPDSRTTSATLALDSTEDRKTMREAYSDSTSERAAVARLGGLW